MKVGFALIVALAAMSCKGMNPTSQEDNTRPPSDQHELTGPPPLDGNDTTNSQVLRGPSLGGDEAEGLANHTSTLTKIKRSASGSGAKSHKQKEGNKEKVTKTKKSASKQKAQKLPQNSTVSHKANKGVKATKKGRDKKNKSKGGKKENKSGRKEKAGMKNRNKKNKKSGKSKHDKNKGNGKKVQKGKGRKAIKKTKGWKKSAKSIRDAANCTFADVLPVIKKFASYSNNLNQNKRIKGYLTLLTAKNTKASTAFNDAAANMRDATSNGTICNTDKPPNATVLEMHNKLQACSATAAKACSFQLSAADNATFTKCEKDLKTYTDQFQACLANGSCSCLLSLRNLTECENQNTILSKALAQKNLCVGGSSGNGSFSDCRQQQIASIPYGIYCKCAGSVTTTSPSSLTTRSSGRLFQRRDILKKINRDLLNF